tara:strand:- start:583 stop:1293 length:711 start_codon:yes stop_codon:yes gene_type:complete
MKVYIGNYSKWFGPYQLAEKLMFWAPKEKDEYGFPSTNERVHRFGEWLAHGNIEKRNTAVGSIVDLGNRNRKQTWLYNFLSWIASKKKRIEYVKIDPWDIWSADNTLALIILPMLKQLKNQKLGAPSTDLEDAPETLHPTKVVDEYSVDEFHFDRWEYILDEMIFAFEHILKEGWEDEFTSGNLDLQFVKQEDGSSLMTHGPDYTYVRNDQAIKEIEDRISNGLRLFGKYYRGLWV